MNSQSDASKFNVLAATEVIKAGILWTDISEGLAPRNDTPATTPIHIKTIITHWMTVLCHIKTIGKGNLLSLKRISTAWKEVEAALLKSMKTAGTPSPVDVDMEWSPPEGQAEMQWSPDNLTGDGDSGDVRGNGGTAVQVTDHLDTLGRMERWRSVLLPLNKQRLATEVQWRWTWSGVRSPPKGQAEIQWSPDNLTGLNPQNLQGHKCVHY
ncbi:hypothetical protein VOLCADRAFT_107526 [Volvox carteri f. nagariensis]|uniref:Uncharacterized protein n=1 Tax=Volvox carteri f. nagariensis TaxID=3068 RepID=D8UEL9_VOLCA|nr:uncharacterized protein VOLCADRAFT_107526 [Volvox carteri f. nagariensis]EFJ41907.1 hypothetical protein VOLCADRAFT_107526 [Volvox carteri f. nagariensis]|eukprot:XP_002957105.1 hypothetical protein VOLCADRAFT_107526 [Volvox carteri f. nagariensis]